MEWRVLTSSSNAWFMESPADVKSRLAAGRQCECVCTGKHTATVVARLVPGRLVIAGVPLGPLPVPIVIRTVIQRTSKLPRAVTCGFYAAQASSPANTHEPTTHEEPHDPPYRCARASVRLQRRELQFLRQPELCGGARRA